MASWRDVRNPQSGGAENYTDRLLAELASRGHDVTLFSARVPEQPSVDRINGYSVVRVGGRYSVFRKVRETIRSRGYEGVDLVVEQVNTIPFRLDRPSGATRFGGLIYQTCEEIWPYIAPWPLSVVGRRVLEPKWMREFGDVNVVTLAESSARDLRRLGLQRVLPIPPGLDSTEAPEWTKEGSATCVTVGRLVPYKRVSLVIDACRGLPEIFPGFRLRIVGDGPELERLRRKAPSFVEFHGRVDIDERSMLVGTSHLQLLTSVREGWGLIVTEAALQGTPTLAFDVSGLSDSTVGAGGWVCPPNVEAMARWLPEVLATQLHGIPTTRRASGFGCLPWHEVADRALEYWMSSSDREATNYVDL